MKIRYIQISILLVAFLALNSVTAQEKKLDKANEAFEQYAYIDARAAYLSVVEKGYSSQDVYEKLGDSYYYNGDLANASNGMENYMTNILLV